MSDRALRIGGLALIAFALMAGYAIARPAIESLFLQDWGTGALPWAWLGVALGAVLSAAAWSRLSARVELAALLGTVGAISGLLLAALLFAREAGIREASFLLYIWKDVYIVVLVETFYAFANVVFPLSTARWTYGLFGLVASLGGMIGNFAVGQVAARLGTQRTPWLVLVDLLVAAALGWGLGRRAGVREIERGAPAVRTGLREGLAVVGRSRYLGWVLALIATVQVCTNLIDFAWSGVVEREIPNLDQRTAVIGQVYGGIDALNILLNLLTGPILRLAGVPATLLGVPLVLAGAVSAAILTPGFLAMAVAKVANKAMDYSLFRSAKEALYLPLSWEEKTQGKAVVDMMTYRVAKGAASALVLLLMAAQAQGQAMGGVLVLLVAWIALTLVIVRRYQST